MPSFPLSCPRQALLGHGPRPCPSRGALPAPTPFPTHWAGQRQQRATFFKRSVALADLSFVPPICFDAACQRAADTAFAVTLAAPLAILLGVVIYTFRPLDLKDSPRLFEDESTGIVFDARDGSVPERDKQGDLAFRAISYTPWPVDREFEGVRLRLEVGPVGARELRTFVFNPLLPQPSNIIAVTLPRPLGVVFEYDVQRKHTVVAELVPGAYADKQAKAAVLEQGLYRSAMRAVVPGDVLRGVTCTNFVYGSSALVGAVPPKRTIVVFGADRQSWAQVRTALGKGDARDGPVTLVLERRVPRT